MQQVAEQPREIYESRENYYNVGDGTAPSYQPSDGIQRTVDDFQARLKAVEGELFELHGVWYQISLWKHGLQYTHFDFVSGTTTSHGDPKNARVRATYNILNAVQKQRMAYFTQQAPKWEARAVKEDGESIEGSKAASYVTRHFERHCNVKRKRADIADWLTTSGNAVAFCGWDPFEGDSWTGYTGESLPSGDWDFQVVPPYQMIVDPEARTIEEARWVGRRRRFWRDDVVQRYPEKEAWIKDEEVSGMDALASYEYAWLRMSHRHGLYGSGNAYLPHGRNMVTLYEFWERPSHNHPEGRYFVMTRDGIDLELGPNPYGKRFPFAFFKEIPVEGSFWGRSILHDLLYIQTEINRRESQKSEHCNLTGNPPFVYFEGDGFKPNKFTNMVGQKIKLNPTRHPGMVPQYIRTPELSMTLREMVPEAMKFVDFISQQFGVSRGESTSQIRSGVQQMMMQEADSMNMNSHMADWEAGWEHVYKLALFNFQAFAALPRKMRVLGSNNQWRVQYLSSDDILEDTDIEITPGSTHPQSKSATFTQMLALLQAGAFNLNDPSDNQKFWEMLEMGDAARIIADKKLDLEKAQRAIDRMKRGQRPIFDPIIDNPQVHLDAISSFMKSAEFEIQPPLVKMQALMYRVSILQPMQGYLSTPTMPDGFGMFPPEGGDQQQQQGGLGNIGPQNAGPAPESQGTSKMPAEMTL